MTVEQMNKKYGTEETNAFSQPTWFVTFNKKKQTGCLITFGSYWSVMDYEDGSYFNEAICKSLDDAYTCAIARRIK